MLLFVPDLSVFVSEPRTIVGVTFVGSIGIACEQKTMDDRGFQKGSDGISVFV
jgi:hypothetical protein